MILCTTLLIELYCTFFKFVTNPLQKLKNGPLYSGRRKLSKFVRFFYMEIWQFDYYENLKIMKIITACAKIIKVFSTKIIIICADSLYSNTREEMKCP